MTCLDSASPVLEAEGLESYVLDHYVPGSGAELLQSAEVLPQSRKRLRCVRSKAIRSWTGPSSQATALLRAP